jgi:DUF218 domain
LTSDPRILGQGESFATPAFGNVIAVALFPKHRSERYLRFRLIHRRTGWFPTWFGLFCVFLLLALPIAWWWTCGESYLSLTRRLPPDVLAVEGWIGYDGIRAAATEFQEHGYQYVVTTGSQASKRWNRDRFSYAQMAERELVRSGVPPQKIIVAPGEETETQRTFDSAVAAWHALQSNGIHPKTLNVFTWAPHARRSQLVFAKAARSETDVGVIAWAPPCYQAPPWWRSSERSRELLTETAGFLFEFFFDSGRRAQSSNQPATHDLAQNSHPEVQMAAQ